MIKLDKRKKYNLILDTEATGTLKNPLVYDLGFIVADKKGNIIFEDNYLINQIFFDNDLMQQAYFYDKVSSYYKALSSGKIKVTNVEGAKKIIDKTLKYFNISTIMAYNVAFDKRALNNTMLYLCNKPFFDEHIDFNCIWNLACQVICKQKTFKKENIRNEKGNLITNAERVYQYVTGQKDFKEEHTSLSDAKIENEILVNIYKQHKSVKNGINSCCWKIPQD